MKERKKEEKEFFIAKERKERWERKFFRANHKAKQ